MVIISPERLMLEIFNGALFHTEAAKPLVEAGNLTA